MDTTNQASANQMNTQPEVSFEALASQAQSPDVNDETLEALGENLKRLFDCQAATLFSYDSNTRQLFSHNFRHKGFPEIRVDISVKNLAGYVAATGKALNIKNVHSQKELSRYHPDLRYNADWDRKIRFKTKSMMVIPLPHEKKLVGVMELINKIDAKGFSEIDFMKAKAISPMMGLALAKLEEPKAQPSPEEPAAKPVKVIKIRSDHEERLHNISHAIHSAKNVDEILVELNAPIMELFKAEAITIYAVDEHNSEIYSKVKSGENLDEIRLPIAPTSIAGFVATEHRLTNINNVSDPQELSKYHPDLRFDASWDEKTQITTRSVLALPLMHQSKLMGILQLINKEDGEGFDALDEKNAFIIAETLALALFNQKKFQKPKPTKFGYLTDNVFISDDELTLALAKSRKEGIDIEDVFMLDLYLRREDIGKSLESFYGIAYSGFDPSRDIPDPESLGLDLNALARENWIPLQHDDSHIQILVNDPGDEILMEKIRQTFPDHSLEIRVGLKADIQDFIHQLSGDTPPEMEKAVGSASEETSQQKIFESPMKGEGALQVEEVEPEAGGGLPIRDESEIPESMEDLLNQILTTVYEHGVTDLHIEPGMEGKNITVRLRKDGACRLYQDIPGKFHEELVSLIKNMGGLDPAKKDAPQNGTILWNNGPNQLELSAIIFPTVGDVEDVMIRVLRAGKPFPTYHALGEVNFSQPNESRIQTLIEKPKGLVLVAGPPGSGKTTTLHALLGHINTPEKKILTAENPVEIRQEGLRQIQINEEAGLDMTCALRTFLMGAPDVILAGEMHDAETFSIGLEASANHLICTALNADSALGTIKVLRDLGVDSGQLGDSLLFIVAQRLIRTLCPHCKEDYHLAREEFDTLARFYGEEYFPELGVEYSDDLMIKRAVGCKRCIYSGYAGKTTLQEVLEATQEIKNMIAENAPLKDVHAQGIKDGMITLTQDGIYKVFKGDCDLKQIQSAGLPIENEVESD